MFYSVKSHIVQSLTLSCYGHFCFTYIKFFLLGIFIPQPHFSWSITGTMLHIGLDWALLVEHSKNVWHLWKIVDLSIWTYQWLILQAFYGCATSDIISLSHYQKTPLWISYWKTKVREFLAYIYLHCLWTLITLRIYVYNLQNVLEKKTNIFTRSTLILWNLSFLQARFTM